MTQKPRTVLLLGSGPLQIGQAGEFDYSGSQALKALREQGVRSVLVNPNIATIQTSEELADRVYLAPVNVEYVTQVIEREGIDAIMLSFGGQTALNCGLELDEQWSAGRASASGSSARRSRRSATPRTAGSSAKDSTEIGVRTARSIACSTIDEARQAIEQIGLPVMLRGGYALGWARQRDRRTTIRDRSEP